MRDDYSVLKWSFAGATEPELSGSDYYEEFGVPKRGTRLRVRPRDAGRWRWLAGPGPGAFVSRAGAGRGKGIDLDA